jgi:oligoendopeptidase F
VWHKMKSLTRKLFAPDGDDGLAVLTRDKVPDEYKWHLEDLYATDEDWDKDAAKLVQEVEKLKGLEGKLASSASSLLEALQLQDKLSETGSRLIVYARMHLDEDNTSAKYQGLTDKAMALAVQMESATAFLVPEILQIHEKTIESFFASESGLQLYKFEIDEILRQKPHILSGKEEELLASMGEIAHAPQQIFTMYNNADMKFPTIKGDDGRDVEITHGRYITFLESTNRDVRKNAFEAVYSTYGKHRNTLAAIYGASVKKDVFFAKTHHYESARAAALEGDNVPLSVYDNLITAVHDSLPALHKYLELRKRVLGLDDLQLYDLYTPIVQNVDMKIPYEEARKTVQEAIGVLGSEYQKIATEGLSSGWVDVYETKGKRSGAYSWGAYPVHPYILLNYQETLDNMFTLAHELGHAMHTYFSYREQPYTYAHYTIFVAEVASTCNEALLMHHLLKNTEDKQKKALLLNHHLETIRGTVFRQTMFAEFEKLTHAHVEAGEALTPEWLCKTYYDLNQTYFGNACHVNQEIELEWARIPHFYNAFYVYKYATGLSAATALSERIIREGEPAIKDYLSFLQSGGSDYPINLLRKAGVDMESPEPVKATLSLFSRLVDELSGLVE